MTTLTVSPNDYGLTPVAPAQRFGAVSGRRYTNRIGGQRWEMSLMFNNMTAKNFAKLRASILKLIQNPTITSLPTTGTSRATHLSGNGYVWVDFRKLRIPQTVGPRTITAVSGSVLTLNSPPPTGLAEAEFVTVGSELCSVDKVGASSITVWPRPVQTITPNTVQVFHAQGLHGGWFELPGDSPEWMFGNATDYYGKALTLSLQSVL